MKTVYKNNITMDPSGFVLLADFVPHIVQEIRYSFTQCPNAEFAKRHHMEDILPVLCNCDHLAMQAIHAALIREGTCVTSDCCDYCIVGDKNPIAAEYMLVKAENGLLFSVRKEKANKTGL